MKYIGERESHYGLRKLSIGVASVLLEISVYGVVGHADNEVPVSDSKNHVSVSENVGDVNDDANDQVVLQSKTGGDNSSTQNIGKQGIRNQGNAISDVSDSQNTLNISGVQNDVKPQNNAVAVNDSKVQVNNDNIAKNVSGDWYWNRNIVSNQDIIHSIIGNDTYRMGLSLSFDLDGSQLKAGNVIDIAKLTQSSDSQGESSFIPESTSVPVSIQGQDVGYLKLTPQGTSAPDEAIGVRFSELDYRLYVTAANLNFQGTQHMNFHTDWIGTLNYSGAWSFRGTNGGLVTYHLIGDKLDKEYKVQYSWPSSKIEKKYTLGYSLGADAGAFLNDGGWTNPGIWVYSPILDGADSEQLKLFQESDGTKGNFSLDHNVQVAARIRADKGNSILYSVSNASTNLFYPLTDVNGSLITQNMGGDNDSIILGYSYTVSIPQKAFANDLTLDQLKAFNYQGLAVSLQSDGSLLWYFNLPVKMFQFDFSKLDDRTIQQIANSELYFNHFAKSDQDAIDMVKQMASYWANGPLKGTPQRLRFNGSGVMVSDPSSHPNVYLDLLDVNTGKVVQTSEEVGQYTDTSVKGQSTVKLHVVSSTNGTDLVTVKSFTDWPNQGKHAQLDIPTIAGYQLADNPQSILTKFHLNGKVITANSAVDYPAENTIANYYIVMTPKDESMTVNIVDDDENGKVLDSGTISGKFGDKVVENSDIQSKVKKLLDSGLYTLESNDLDNGLMFKDGSQTATVKLKHKLDSVQRHYRVIEDLPDGTKKVIIDMEAMLYKDAARKYYEDYGAWTKDGKLLKHNEVKLLKQTNILDNPGSAMDYVNATVDSVTGYHHYIDRSVYPHYGDYYGGLGVWGDNSTVWMDLFRRGDPHDDVGFATNIFPSTDFHIVYAPKDEAATVNIIDVDENNKVLSTGTVTGKFNTQIVTNDDVQAKLKSLLDTGHYVLQSNGFDQAAKYQDGTNTITIALKHKIDSTQRHYRVIEDLPDGTKKVIVDYQVTLYKDSNAKYYNEYGAYADGDSSSKPLLKRNEIRIITGQVYDPYKVNQFGDIEGLADVIPGYHARMDDAIANWKDGVHATLMDNGYAHVNVFNLGGVWNDPSTGECAENPLASRDFHVEYYRNSYSVMVNYYDLSGALISSSKSQHLFADSVDIAPSIPTNYVLAPGQSTHFTVSYDTNELDLVVIPRVTISTDSRTITRTIQITRPDRSISTVVQHVTFSRPAYRDAVSGAITYGLWTTPSRNFIAYQPETIDGYHIDMVKSQAVLPTDKDSIVQVVYTKLETSPTYPYIDVAGHSYTVLPAGYHVVAGQNTKSRSTSALIVKDTGIKPADDVQYVTRTVTITLPNGRKRVIHQRVRQGTRFGKVAIPKLRGYKVVISGDSQKLGPTSADRDMNMSVKFIKM